MKTPEHADELRSYQWLASDDARPFLNEAANFDGPLHQLILSLRKKLEPIQAQRISQQLELRERAKAKFAAAERMLFTPQLLEQSTDETIARYKASRFPTDVEVSDICCGIGGDLIGLMSRGRAVGIDADPIATLLAEFNLKAQSPPLRPALRTNRIESNTLHSLAAAKWLHIDPDRRASGRRVTAWESCVPGAEVLRRLREQTDGMAVKVAAATEPPEDWSECERDWIGSRGECRQQVVWCGQLATAPGRRSATVIHADGVARLVESPGAEAPTARSLGQYLYEPHAAVLAADLAATLAANHACESAAPHGGYLTSHTLFETPLAAGFLIVDQSPFDIRKVRRMLQDHNVQRLEVKRRGITDTPDAILKRLKWRDSKVTPTHEPSSHEPSSHEPSSHEPSSHEPSSHEGRRDTVHTLIVTRLPDGVVTALCRRTGSIKPSS